MPVYVKDGAIGGGTWRQIADGNIRVKQAPWERDANTYFVPSKAYAKIGDIGGGTWRDTGYQSFPHPPTMPWVQAWDYSNTLTGFNGPSGGPPIDYYHIEKLDANGTPVEGYYDTSGSRWWSTPQDTRWQFRVRSHGVNGLWSNWVGNLRVGIGHPETYNYGWVERTRYWQSETVSGYRNKDDPFWFGVPSRVYLYALRWRNLRTGGMSSVVAPYNNRNVNWIILGTDWGSVTGNTGTMYNGHNYDHAFGNWCDGSAWGIVARGTGWSTTGNGYYMLVCDGLWGEGTQYYDNWEHVSTNPGQGNYYW